MTCFVLVLAMVGTVTGFYVTTKVPTPSQISTNQVSTITYADGKTPMAKIGAQNRTDVKISQVPVPVRNDVLAAEDRGFYSEPGISPKGIARAAWSDVRGGSVQGGSTITQQYVKNAFLTQQRTFSRKFREIFIAVKLDRHYSKDQILEWYLNTIYFGRGAYGIQAAAETYFGRSVDKLTVAQGAVLASSIRSPALYDPENHPAHAKARWQFVLDGMVKMGKMTQRQVDAQHYPKVQPIGRGTLNQFGGPKGYIVAQVKAELAANGFDESKLNRDGLRIVTTIDPKAQHDAEQAVAQTFAGQPKDLRQSLVAIDPGTGKVLAYYGGATGDGFDYARAWRQPGSTFKPYVLAAALTKTQQGKADITDQTEYDGASGQTLGGVVVHNSDGESCAYCSVTTAMTESLNTVFYQIGLQIGPDQVAATAHAVGIPIRRTDTHQRTLQDSSGHTGGGISIGQYEVRPIDQAAGYATIASGGVRRAPYFVQEVTDAAGHVLYQHKAAGKRVLSAQVANDVTYSMESVAAYSGDALDGRQSAAKTGTAQLAETGQNKDAWMSGFTPKVSATVWVGTDQSKPILNSAGNIVYGSGLPGQAWRSFMNSYLADSAPQPLPSAPVIGSGDTPPASSSPPATSPTQNSYVPTQPPSTTPPPTTVPPTTPPPTTVPPTTAPPTTAPTLPSGPQRSAGPPHVSHAPPSTAPSTRPSGSPAAPG
ncbi:MAG TPA: transglycosylase domain-containing protein [Mycobacteriales bacterium]|nr:transglycosylase domain-containing protein [Mycobacteriales bacterium]